MIFDPSPDPRRKGKKSLAVARPIYVSNSYQILVGLDFFQRFRRTDGGNKDFLKFWTIEFLDKKNLVVSGFRFVKLGYFPFGF